MKLIERRRKYLFTFFTESALHYHVKKMKKLYKGKNELKEVSEFLIHNIRKFKIRAAFEEGGLAKA
jgi:hypothetical protein